MDLLIHLPSCQYCSKSLGTSAKASESSLEGSAQEPMTSCSSLPRPQHGQLSPPPSSPVMHAQSASNVFAENDKQEQNEDEGCGSRDQEYQPGAELSLSYHLYGHDLEDVGDLDDILYGNSDHDDEEQDEACNPQDGKKAKEPIEEMVEDLDMADMTLSPGPGSPVPPNTLDEATEVYLPRQQILQQDPSIYVHVGNTLPIRRRRLIQEEEEEEEEEMEAQESSERGATAAHQVDDQELPRSQQSEASSSHSEAMYVSQEEFQPGQRMPPSEYGSPSPAPRADPPRNPQSRSKDPQSPSRHPHVRDLTRHKRYRIPSPGSQNDSDNDSRRHHLRHYRNHIGHGLALSYSQPALTSPSGSSRSDTSPEAQLAKFLALTQPAPYRIGKTEPSQSGHSFLPLMTHVPRYMKSRRKVILNGFRRTKELLF